MKKLITCLVLWTLGLCAFGQGTAYITKSNYVGYPYFIRQCNLAYGYHVTYSTDVITGQKGYVGVTDIYNFFYNAQITDGYTINDIEVHGTMAYFCGHTSINNGLIGWLDITWLFTPSLPLSSNVDTTTLSAKGITSLDNIEVYTDGDGNTCIVGYGTGPSGNMGLECVNTASNWNYRVAGLPYIPQDLIVTDDFVVFAGTLTNREIVLHPFPKNGVFSHYYVPNYTYIVGSATAIEPLVDLRIADVGNNHVATLTYRFEGAAYRMMLREFDVANSFIGYSIPMLTSYRIPFRYSAATVSDFLYNQNKMCYTILHNYEVNPSDFHDAVTEIDFSPGTPTSVQSKYLAIINHSMNSISLADSMMYAVYGCDNISMANVFWKDFQGVIGTGACLKADELPIINVPTVPDNRLNRYYGIPFMGMLSPSMRSNNRVSETITTICH